MRACSPRQTIGGKVDVARHVPGVFKAALPGTLVFMADGCFAVGFVGAFVVPVARGHERLHPAVGSGEGSDRRNLGSTPCTTKNGERTATQRVLATVVARPPNWRFGNDSSTPPPARESLTGKCRWGLFRRGAQRRWAER